MQKYMPSTLRFLIFVVISTFIELIEVMINVARVYVSLSN